MTKTTAISIVIIIVIVISHVVRAYMIVTPFTSTNITKLIATSACHVITALALFNDVLALTALPIVQIVFEKVHLVLLAGAFVLLKEALPAEYDPAHWTLRILALVQDQDALVAVL